jgi:hypothetical protein
MLRTRHADALTALVIALVIGVLYLATASDGPAQVNDTRAATVASWTLGTTGSVHLPGDWPASRNYWGVETDDGRVVVGRFPGIAYWAAPAYALVALAGDEEPEHPLLVDPRPAAVTAAATAALVAGVLFLLLRTELARGPAVLATVVAAAGTALWSVASDALWPHAPAMLGLAVMLLAWRRDRVVVAAFGAGLAVLIRPHVVVAVLLVAGYAWWRDQRRAGTALAIGGLGGLAALSLYSAVVFGTWLPVAGYDAAAHLDGLALHTPWQTLREFGLAFVWPSRGMLASSPVLLPAIVAAVLTWRRLPGWTRACAVAAAVLLVVQVRAVGHRGGADLATYRVSLEALVLAAPALVLATVEVLRDHRWVRPVVAVLAAASIGLHAHAAVVGGIDGERVRTWERIDAQLREASDRG